MDLADQGLCPDYIVADGGRGLRAGQALAWPGMPCHGDVFHGLRELTRLSATLERRAYAAIAQRDALEQQMEPAQTTLPGPCPVPATRPRLDQALDGLAQRFAVPVFRLRQVLAPAGTGPPTTPTYWSQRATLASTRSTASSMLSTRPSWNSVTAYTAPAPWWRTSSSRLRNYFFLRRQTRPPVPGPVTILPQPLTLLAQSASRAGRQNPRRALERSAHPHWLELLGFTRFQRSPQAA